MGQSENGHCLSPNGVVLKGRCSSSSLNQRPFSTVKAERRCSSKSSVGFSYGRLNGGQPSTYRRYQPAGLYISRGAPKNRGWLVGGREKKKRKKRNQQEEKHKQSTELLGSSPEPKQASLTNSDLRKTREKISRERVETVCWKQSKETKKNKLKQRSRKGIQREIQA